MDLDVGETTNLERIVATSLSRDEPKRYAAGVPLKDYIPLEPITAENNILRPKQKRQMHGLAYDSNQMNHLKSQIPINYRQNIGTNLIPAHQQIHHQSNPLFHTQTFLLNDSNEEDLKFLHEANALNSHLNMESTPDLLSYADKMQPRSIYLNKIITKRCNDDNNNNHQFSSFSINNLDSRSDEDQRKFKKMYRDIKQSNDIAKMNENQNTDLDTIAPRNRYHKPIVCKKNSNGESGDNRESDCILRPAFGDLYGYPQLLN